MTEQQLLPGLAPETLPRLMYRDVPVITTGVLAQLYGTEPVNIRNNFHKRRQHFQEGKHFFLIGGPELNDLRSRVTNGYSPFVISPQTRTLTVWTERGSARHAKILDTWQAWGVWERMEDSYFRSPPMGEPPAARVNEIPSPQPLAVPAPLNIQLLPTDADLAELQGECVSLRAEIRALRQESTGLKDELLDLHRKYLARIEAPKPERKPPKPITDEMVQEMVGRRTRGQANAEIAREMDVSQAAVSFILRGALGGAA